MLLRANDEDIAFTEVRLGAVIDVGVWWTSISSFFEVSSSRLLSAKFLVLVEGLHGKQIKQMAHALLHQISLSAQGRDHHDYDGGAQKLFGNCV